MLPQVPTKTNSSQTQLKVNLNFYFTTERFTYLDHLWFWQKRVNGSTWDGSQNLAVKITKFPVKFACKYTVLVEVHLRQYLDHNYILNGCLFAVKSYLDIPYFIR